jgi:hypothetical protein
LLLALASAVILRSESRGTHDHVLFSQIRDSTNLDDQAPVFVSRRKLYPQVVGSVFITSYDSQGYGGGIRTRLHTALLYGVDIKYLKYDFSVIRSRDSSVGIATGYGLDDQGSGGLSPDRVKNFYFSISSRPALGSTQSRGSFPGVKWQGREADHSPPASAEVKKMWIYTCTPLYVFMA